MLDLDAYIAHYTGATRLERLSIIAQSTSDAAVSAQAFALLEQQCKQDGNVMKYKEIFMGIENDDNSERQAAGAPSEQSVDVNMSHSPPPRLQRNYRPFDANWATNQEDVNQQDRHVLQGRLSTAQAHLHKDAIRNAYLSLAEHDRKTGHLQDGLASLLRSTDYCTSRQQTAEVSVLILELCLSQGNFAPVREYVTKMEHTLSGGTASTDPFLQRVGVQLKIALGLERLAQQDFDYASQMFTKVLLSATTVADLEWPGVASAQDISLYTSLLSLACQSRSMILTLSEHPEALELVPSMKELLSQWSRANYVDCMKAISSERESELIPLGDLYLKGDRWKALRKSIQDKCLLEYLQPYQTVQLDHMSQLFPSFGTNLEDTLVDLMSRGLIPNAKIDARKNILIKYEPKPTVHLAGMEQRVLDDIHGMLIRLACLEHDLIVRDGRGGGGSSSRGGTNRRGGRAGGTSSLDPKENPSDDEDDEDDDSTNDALMRDVDAAPSAANPEDLY